MQSPKDIQIDAQDVINTLTNQRNAAMDEIVKMGAIISALQKQIKELEKKDGEAEQH